jgi:hypothetical protein
MNTKKIYAVIQTDEEIEDMNDLVREIDDAVYFFKTKKEAEEMIDEDYDYSYIIELSFGKLLETKAKKTITSEEKFLN